MLFLCLRLFAVFVVFDSEIFGTIDAGSTGWVLREYGVADFVLDEAVWEERTAADREGPADGEREYSFGLVYLAVFATVVLVLETATDNSIIMY